MNTQTSKVNKTLALVLLSIAGTWFLYHIISHLFYFPFEGAVGGREVFLTPRYYLEMNDLKTSVFREWWALFGVIVFYFFGGIVTHSVASNTKINFNFFLGILYVTALFFAFAFHYFSPLGFSHLENNIISLNNGSYVGLKQMIGSIEWLRSGFIEKIQYVIKELYPTDCHYTVIGWTHPWGAAFVTLLLFFLAEFLNPQNIPFFIGATVTLINALLLPVIVILIKKCSGEFWARRSVIFLLFIPSVLFHTSSMFEQMASVLVALLVWLTLSMSFFSWGKALLWGGLALLIVQWSYGMVIPVTLLFILSLFHLQRSYFLKYVGSIALLASFYFGIEFIFSSGASFYLKRALACVSVLGGFQEASRPYPLSQIANFTIMSIMGGVLFLPIFLNYLFEVKAFIKEEKSRYLRSLVFLLLAGYITLLIFIRTPLEVERTWHWIFVFSWPLMGEILKKIKNEYWIVFVSQVLISLALALTIQDYY